MEKFVVSFCGVSKQVEVHTILVGAGLSEPHTIRDVKFKLARLNIIFVKIELCLQY